LFRTPTGHDPAGQREAAHAWTQWESHALTLLPDREQQLSHADDASALAFARIENHYFMNGGFLEEGQLLRNAHVLRDIPGVIVQGRYDACTPMRTAWELHQAWPEAEFHVVDDGGHAFDEPGILGHLLAATDRFRD